MNVSSRSLALCSLLTILPMSAPSVAAPEGADWPQWRGPDRTGVSPETGWSAVGKADSLWDKAIGFGHSSFAVAGGKVFTMGYDDERKLDVVYCLDAESGVELWAHTYPADIWNQGHDGGTCTTPTLVGDTLFTSNREGNVYSLNAETGSVKWTRNLVTDHEVTPPRWGFSGSPVVVDDTIIMNVGKVAGLDRISGETSWITEKSYGNAYSTPIEFDYLGTPSVLVLNGEGLAVIDRNNGSEIAFHPFTRDPQQAVHGSTPIIYDGKIFLSSGSGGGSVMLEPTDNGLEVVWESRQMRTSYAGCVLYEGHIYGFDQHILKCIDLEGNEKWRQRGIGLGAMSIAGGRLVIIGAKGEIVIVEATPEKYVELSREKVLSGGAYWSTPVLSQGLVYARNSLGDMVCRDYRGSDDNASSGHDAPAELPVAETLLGRHVEAIGGAEALRSVTSAYYTGVGEQHGGGPIDHSDATMTWTASGSFKLQFSTGFEFGITPDKGWSVSQRGASLMERGTMDNLLEAVNLHRVLADNWGFESMETVDSRIFDDRDCYVVNATRPDGATRTLYFESETGRLAGQEGEDTSLWVYNDYQETNGVAVPMNLSFFASGNGSMTMANFDTVEFNSLDVGTFDPPQLIVMMTRTDAEKAEANKTLEAKYSELVGNYKLADGQMAGTPVNIMIGEGGIQFSFGGQAPSYLTEPDDKDQMQDMSNPIIVFQIDRDDSGAYTGMRVFVQGDEFGKLEPVED